MLINIVGKKLWLKENNKIQLFCCLVLNLNNNKILVVSGLNLYHCFPCWSTLHSWMLWNSYGGKNTPVRKTCRIVIVYIHYDINKKIKHWKTHIRSYITKYIDVFITSSNCGHETEMPCQRNSDKQHFQPNSRLVETGGVKKMSWHKLVRNTVVESVKWRMQLCIFLQLVSRNCYCGIKNGML